MLSRASAALIATVLVVGTGPSTPVTNAASPLGRAPDGRTMAVPGDPRPMTEPIAVPENVHRDHSAKAQDPATLAAAKMRAAQDFQARPSGDFRGQPSGSTPGPLAVVEDGLNQPGFRAGFFQYSTPPDATGAIGPSAYIEMVNSGVGIYSRDDLSRTMYAGLNSLAPGGDDLFDPQIQWDEQAHRYLFAMVDIEDSGANFLVVGWSKDGDPSDLRADSVYGSGDWCAYFAYANLSELEDFPKLGHNDNNIIVGTNVFLGDDFVTSRIWAIEKPAVGDTSCPANLSAFYWGTSSSPLVTEDEVDLAFTPVPVNTFGASADGYVVAADFGTGDSELTLWNVTGPAEAPTLSWPIDIPVSPYAVPPNIPQPGSARLLDSSDGRLTQAVAAPDPDASGALAIWTQHTIAASSGRSRVRWYEIVPSAPIQVRQEGNIDRPGLFAFNGAISPTAGGNAAVINYNVGSSTQRVQIRAQSRTSLTATHTMEGEITIATSVDYARDFSCTSTTPCRWGDYAGASPDPVNSALVWGTSQVIGTYPGDGWPHWITRNFALSATVLPADTTAPVVEVPQRELRWYYSASMVAITVEWPPAPDPSGIILYELQMKTGTGSFAPVVSTTDTSFGLELAVGTSYTFRVRATDGANNVGPWATTTSAQVKTVQEKATSIHYTSGWKRAALSGSLGGYVKKSTATNSMATFTFTGESALLISTSYTDRGILSWRVDGGPWQNVDMYWKPIRKKFTAFAATGLGPGTHTIDVLVTGTKSSNSTGTRIDIDAFIVHP